MRQISQYLNNVTTIVIAGHVNPDGDCTGACMALYEYFRKNEPELAVTVYLEETKPEFDFLTGMDHVQREKMQTSCDLFISLDVSTKDRIGVVSDLFDSAKQTVCIDHHVSNQGYADDNVIEPDASSSCEVLYGLLEEEKITREVAEALYMGIVHDTGVFQYSCTQAQTMRVAASLLEKGIDAPKIIRDTFLTKTYAQMQIMGRTMLESVRIFDGKCIFGYVTRHIMDFYGVTKQDLDGIVSQLCQTKGVEVAIFAYETGTQEYKVSLRSTSFADVNRIASYFGGGGHVRAAGCVMQGSIHDVINNLLECVQKELEL